MAPRQPRKPAAATTASASPDDVIEDGALEDPSSQIITVVPPKGPAPASSLPELLKFPVLALVGLSLGSIANTAYYTLDGPRLDGASPDGNPQWQVYAALAWKLTELAVSWFGGFDWRDVAALTVLTHAPHPFLLSAYYEIPASGLALLFAINVAATSLPFYMLRRPASFHAVSTPDNITSDRFITLLTTLFSTLLYALPYLALTISGWLPVFMVTYFDGLRTLDYAHATTLPSLAPLLAPLGYAASAFFFVPAAHSLSAAGKTSYVMTFDPVNASLGQTLHRNLLWHLYLPARAREVWKRVVIAVALTLGHTAFWAFLEVDGVDALGALGWAGVWSLGALTAGVGMAWVGGLAEF